jgi:hypothetical protein
MFGPPCDLRTMGVLGLSSRLWVANLRADWAFILPGRDGRGSTIIQPQRRSPRSSVVAVTWRRALNRSSNSDDGDLAPRSPDKPFQVIGIARENDCVLAKRCRHYKGVNNIGSSGFSQQASCFVPLTLSNRNDRATSQKAAELGLLWRAANLGEDRRRNRRNNAEFQTRLVFCPCPPVVPVRRDENSRVVDNRAHARRRTF